jgi:hypothetical protein
VSASWRKDAPERISDNKERNVDFVRILQDRVRVRLDHVTVRHDDPLAVEGLLRRQKSAGKQCRGQRIETRKKAR